MLESLTRSSPVQLSMSQYRIKGNSLAQHCQIIDRSNLQSKLSKTLNIIYTYIVHQHPPKN